MLLIVPHFVFLNVSICFQRVGTIVRRFPGGGTIERMSVTPLKVLFMSHFKVLCDYLFKKMLERYLIPSWEYTTNILSIDVDRCIAIFTLYILFIGIWVNSFFFQCFLNSNVYI